MTSIGLIISNLRKLIPELKLLSVSFLLLFLLACDSNKLFEKNTNIYNSLWSRLELISFEVPEKDTIKKYNLYLNIRNNTDYAFSNLYLFMNTIYPDKKVSRDTIECILADKNGKWYGKGWGKYRLLNLQLGKNIRFPQKGTYTFQLEQAMRKDTLENITDIGIRIEKTRQD